MSVRPEIREAVLAQIADAMEGATGAVEAVRMAQQRYPGTPSTVCLDAWNRRRADATEAWWATVEKTIDVEIVRRAIETK